VSTYTGRREFLKRMAQGAGVATTGGLLWSFLLGQQRHARANMLRPPGALNEPDFAATCIKCGQCVQACPYGTLSLSPSGAEVPIGTPSFSPRDVPCYMCVDIPCMQACPTGALEHDLERIEDARMGVATIDHESCLSWQGLRCEICYRECPVRNDAITVENRPRRTSGHALFVPVVHASHCTGCGICEYVCPTEVAAIHVLPPELVQGKIGDHYLLSNDAEVDADGGPSASPAGDHDAVPGLEYLNEGER
jgi:ferredoxin-type protein NapG